MKTNTGTYPVVDEDRVVFSSTWVNCKGLGLECFEDVTSGWCSRPRTECDPNASQSSCSEGRIYKCADPDGDGKYEYEQKPACSDFGLVCEDEWQDNMGWTDCIGAGASCVAYDVDYLRQDRAMFTLKYGTKCESATAMRGCIRTNESAIDCADIGKGFQCLPWSGIAVCGFATECDSTDPVACDGDSIVVCDAGKKRKVNCKDLGFKTCDPSLVACGPTDLAIFPR